MTIRSGIHTTTQWLELPLPCPAIVSDPSGFLQWGYPFHPVRIIFPPGNVEAGVDKQTGEVRRNAGDHIFRWHQNHDNRMWAGHITRPRRPFGTDQALIRKTDRGEKPGAAGNGVRR